MMPRLLPTALLSGLLVMLVAPASAVEFHAAPDGSRSGEGTADDPLTLMDAQRRAREYRRLSDEVLDEPVRIILHGGRYALDQPWYVRPEDSGSEASPTVFEAAEGETPVFCGGVAVKGWSKLGEAVPGLPASALGHVWVADAPFVGGRPREFRQLWVGGDKAVRARSPNDGELDRVLTWDKKDEVTTIPLREGIAGDLRALEFVIYQQWEIAVLRVSEFTPGDDHVSVRFHQPESRIQFEHPWPAPIMTDEYRAPFFLQNALCLLDSPGEWFHDQVGHRIYYWPREGEDPEDAIVPVQETLLDVAGTLDRPVRHVHFEGLDFNHTAWLRPALFGHVPHQAGMQMTEAYKMLPPGTPEKDALENQAWVERPPGAARVWAGHGIRFLTCRFEHLASAGLDAEHGLRDLTVEGCLFRDIGGNGLQLGKFQDGGIETHFPYDPADDREVSEKLTIAQNLVTDCANEDWGCVGIAVGYARVAVIFHNDIDDLPYSGISLGWGWTRRATAQGNNHVWANRITRIGRILYDCAGIYHLSASPGTAIFRNHVGEVVMSPYTAKPHWGHLYLDEGSSYVTVRDNWTASEKKILNNNGPANTYENNGPHVSDEIRDQAGQRASYRERLGLPPREE